MAEEKSRIELFIDAVLNSASVKAFVAGVAEGAKEAADAVGETTKKSGEEAEAASDKSTKGKEKEKSAVADLKNELGGMVAQYISLQAAVAYVGEAFKAAIAEQKLNAQVLGNMQALTGATEAQAQATLDWLDAAEMASAVDKSELAPALNDLAAATGNLTQAQAATNIAAGAAARGLGDFSSNAKTLATALETGVIPKKTAFGKELANLVTKTGSLDGAIKALNARYGDAGAGVDNAAMAVGRSGVQWDNAKEAVGGMLQKLVIDLMPALKWVAMAIAGVIGTVKLLIAGFKLLGDKVGAVAGLMVNALTGDWKTALQTFREQTQEANDAFMTTFTEVGDSIDSVAASFDNLNTKAAVAGATLGTFSSGKGKGEGGEPVKVDLGQADFGAGEGLQERLDREREAEEERLERQRLTLELMAESEDEYNAGLAKILAAREALYAKGSKEQLQIAIERKKTEQALEQSAANQKAKAVADWQRAAARGDIGYFAELKKQQKKDLDNFKGTIEQKKKLEQDYNKTAAKLAKMRADQAAKYGRAGLETAKGLFGEKKEMAIAEAIINTYEAATAAWNNGGGFPYGAILAALTVAGGLQEIAQIQKADPTSGKGFDDPQNDLVAEIGGQRWARDFTNKWTSGAMRGMSNEILGGGSQTNYNYNYSNPGATMRTTNINVGAMPLIDTGRDAAMRELASGIRTYIDLDRERDIR